MWAMGTTAPYLISNAFRCLQFDLYCFKCKQNNIIQLKVQSPSHDAAVASFIKTRGLSPEISWNWDSTSDTIGHPGYFIRSRNLTKSILKIRDTEQPPVEKYD